MSAAQPLVQLVLAGARCQPSVAGVGAAVGDSVGESVGAAVRASFGQLLLFAVVQAQGQV